MKVKIFLGTGMIFSLLISSCAPIYKCGEEKPTKNVAGSNRLLAVVQERDELCDEVRLQGVEIEFLNSNNERLTVLNDSLFERNETLKNEKDELQLEFNALEDQIEDLQNINLQLSKKFSDEVTKNLEQGFLFNEQLKDKERILAEKASNLEEREKRILDLEKRIARQDSISNRMNNLLRQALLSFDSDELTTEIKNGKVYVSMSDKLMFQSGKADVQKKGVEALGVLANILNKNKEFGILVEGHTDNVPIKTAKYADNWDLSVNRATAIVRILQDKYEVDPLRMTASGKGEFFPRATNDTKEGKAKNRRTEIIISPDLSELMDFLNK